MSIGEGAGACCPFNAPTRTRQQLGSSGRGTQFLELGDKRVDIAPRLKTLKVSEPPVRVAGVKVADVDALVTKLKELGVA